MLTAFIMAGGTGKRFWPLSTKDKPKQLLKLIDPERSMIKMTVDRIIPMIPLERIFVGTNTIQAKAIRDELPALPEENIIIEPAFKDTAAAIGYGAIRIKQLLEDSCQLLEGEDITMVVLASDHVIGDEENFRRRLATARKAAEGNKTIVTLGIKPTRPETGYGYIETEDYRLGEAVKVKSFREKPGLKKAMEYVKEGNFLWNSGMFIFRKATIFESFKRYLPNHFKILTEISNNKLPLNDEQLKEKFEEFERVSIDFGIIEKADNLEVIPVDFGWSDMGSYRALGKVFDKTETGTINKNGRLTEFNSRDNIVIGTGEKKISLVGIEGLVIVETKSEILICKKTETQNIRKIVEEEQSE